MKNAYDTWLAQGQNYELDRFAVTRVAFEAGYKAAAPAKPLFPCHWHKKYSAFCNGCKVKNAHRKLPAPEST